MDICPTVKIISADPEHGGFIVINEEDFNDKIHTLFGAEPADEAPGELTKAEIIADLIAMNVEFDPRALKPALSALRDEARAIRDA